MLLPLAAGLLLGWLVAAHRTVHGQAAACHARQQDDGDDQLHTLCARSASGHRSFGFPAILVLFHDQDSMKWGLHAGHGAILMRL
jgi:hypothetical protein